MLLGYALAILFCAQFVSDQAFAFDPRNSLDRRARPPTPYGLRIVRPEHRQFTADQRYEIAASHTNDTTAFAAEVARIEAEAGPYSSELTQALIGLGVAYRNDGYAQQAVGAFTRAQHVLRINHGLDTPLQIPLLTQLIEGQLALGDYKEADQKNHVLYNLKLRIYQEKDPLRHIATQNFVDWQRSAYLAELGKKKFQRLLQIHNLYADMIAVKKTLTSPDDPTLVPLLYKQMQAEYLISLYAGETQDALQINSPTPGGATAERLPSEAEMQFLLLKKNNFRNGQQTITRILDIYQQNPQTPASDIAKAKIALGDWHIWFGKPAIARHRYEEAFGLLAASEEGQALIDENFGKPVELPTSNVFQPGRLTPRAKHKGEVVMRFSVNRFGETRKIKTVHTDPAMKETDAGRRTYKMLKQVRFRPRMEAGKVVSTEGLERKYYVSY